MHLKAKKQNKTQRNIPATRGAFYNRVLSPTEHWQCLYIVFFPLPFLFLIRVNQNTSTYEI